VPDVYPIGAINAVLGGDKSTEPKMWSTVFLSRYIRHLGLNVIAKDIASDGDWTDGLATVNNLGKQCNLIVASGFVPSGTLATALLLEELDNAIDSL